MFPGPVNRLKHYARIYMQRQEVLRQMILVPVAIAPD